MRKALLSIMVIAIMLSSCATGGGGGDFDDNARREREGAALLLISGDMVKVLEQEFLIPQGDLDHILSRSYLAYSDYVPSFDSLTAEYLLSVSSELRRVALESLPRVGEVASVLSSNPTPFINGNASLTMKLKELLGGELRERFLSGLSESAKIADTWKQTERVFSGIRKAYRNLEAVGKGEELPEPEAADMAAAADYAVSFFFSSLAAKETALKNAPAESGSLYTVFWE